MKTCIGCKKSLDESEFNKCLRTRSGLTGNCKKCLRSASIARMWEIPDKEFASTCYNGTANNISHKYNVPVQEVRDRVLAMGIHTKKYCVGCKQTLAEPSFPPESELCRGCCDEEVTELIMRVTRQPWGVTPTNTSLQLRGGQWT